jgi:hypothetical protein
MEQNSKKQFSLSFKDIFFCHNSPTFCKPGNRLLSQLLVDHPPRRNGNDDLLDFASSP